MQREKSAHTHTRAVLKKKIFNAIVLKSSFRRNFGVGVVGCELKIISCVTEKSRKMQMK